MKTKTADLLKYYDHKNYAGSKPPSLSKINRYRP